MGTQMALISNMEESKTPLFSKRVLDALHKAGWTPQRDEAAMEQAYSQTFGSNWVPAAAPFVRRFGGLSIQHLLWVRPIAELGDPTRIRRITQIVQAKACPIAASNYMGDGCSIWCDENDRFYAVDSEGMVFVGDDVATIMEVLLFGDPLPTPPDTLVDALKKAYEWNASN
jgi:hypothetical protein